MPTEARPKQANFGLTSAEPTPEQALAAAVLRQAVADLHDRQLAPHRRPGRPGF